MGFLDFLFDLLSTEEHTDSWLHSASDDELEEEREKVRQRWCSGDESAEGELERFDKDLRKRNTSNSETGYPAHREHGWYLPNDD